MHSLLSTRGSIASPSVPSPKRGGKASPFWFINLFVHSRNSRSANVRSSFGLSVCSSVCVLVEVQYFVLHLSACSSVCILVEVQTIVSIVFHLVYCLCVRSRMSASKLLFVTWFIRVFVRSRISGSAAAAIFTELRRDTWPGGRTNERAGDLADGVMS